MPVGAISEETETALALKHQTCSARYKELRDWGYIDYCCDGMNVSIAVAYGIALHPDAYVSTSKGRQAVELGLPIDKPGAKDPTRNYHGGNQLSFDAFYSMEKVNPTLRLRILKHIHSKTPSR